MPFDSADAPVGLRLLALFGDDGARWCKGALIDGDGRRCLVGGILSLNSKKSAPTEGASERIMRLGRRLCQHGHRPLDLVSAWSLLEKWNDDPGREWDEVRRVCLEFT